MSDEFPRTNIEHLSVSRMLIGTNWFLGWSHTSAAKDRYIHERVSVRVVDLVGQLPEQRFAAEIASRPPARVR